LPLPTQPSIRARRRPCHCGRMRGFLVEGYILEQWRVETPRALRRPLGAEKCEQASWPDGTNDLVIHGIDAYDNAGHSVSSGDVNGDGYADVIIGAPGDWGTGEVYVVFGKASGWSASMPGV